MAVTPRTFFQPFAAAVFNGVHNFSSHTLKIALTNVEPVSTYANLSSISQIPAGGGYTTGGFAITTTTSSQSAGVYKLILQDYTLSATGAIAEWQYAVLYNDTAAGDPLIAWYTFAVPFNLASGDTFPFDFDGINGALNFVPGNAGSGSVTVAVAPSSVLEDGTSNLIFTFTRTGIATAPLTINYTIGGTAVNGTDYATIGTTATFGSGSTTATVTVNPATDATIESDETVILTVAPGSGYIVGSPSSATGTIEDDDAVTDPNYSSVAVLLPMNGVDGGTSFVDEGPNAITIFATSATTQTDEWKWGGSSGFFSGSGQFLTSDPSSVFAITADFTAEFWLYPLSLTGTRTLLHVNNNGGNQGLHIYTNGDALLVDNGLVADYSSASGLLSLSTWAYIAVAKSGSTLYIAKDSTVLNSRTAQSYGTPNRVQFARFAGGLVTNDAHCYANDLRITNGVARFTSSVTAPTAAFPTS